MDPIGRLIRKKFLTTNFARKRAKARRHLMAGTPLFLFSGLVSRCQQFSFFVRPVFFFCAANFCRPGTFRTLKRRATL
jgi:hypothetical protein